MVKTEVRLEKSRNRRDCRGDYGNITTLATVRRYSPGSHNNLKIKCES
nr:MAG TPA: hypothetical protein [Caudoviricetes sp.]